MGLFSNNKKLCPICGSPTPRLLPTKVEGQALCKGCAEKVDLPSGALDQMTLEGFRRYLSFYEGNQPLRDAFKETYRFNFGFFGADLVFDTEHRLLKLKNQDDALVLEPSHIQSFRILEDNYPLFETSGGALLCHYSDVPDRVNALAPHIDRFYMQQQEYDRMEHMHRLHEQEHGHGDRRPEPPMDRPTFRVTPPVQKFYVELTLSHPYWKEFQSKLGAPDFDSREPSITDYLRQHDEKVNDLHQLATNLLYIMDPAAQERWDGEAEPAPQAAAPSASQSVDAVAEIRRYKELLDAGVITDEEFAAKKRQLMGI